MNLALYVTVAQAAEIAGISDRQVRNALDDGRIEGQKMGPVWMVLRSSAEAFVRKRAPKGTGRAAKRPPAKRPAGRRRKA